MKKRKNKDDTSGWLFPWSGFHDGVFQVSASLHFVSTVCTVSPNLDMDSVEGGVRLQVSDLYGSENPGGWL